jgi:glycosyltransferase involved in cell wall biosynthesis
VKVLSFSYCFPSAARPTWGLFVHQRLAAMTARCDLEVVSPVPVFPLPRRRRGARPPRDDAWGGLTVWRPRFFYFPGVLKNLDARLYARGIRRWLRRHCRRARPDVFDAHFIWPDGVAVARLARGLGLPYVVTLRGRIYPCAQRRAQRRQCAEALRGAAAVISVSGHMANLARELGAPDDRLRVIPNGVDTERFRPRDRRDARRRLDLPRDAKVLLTVAHLGPRKGHREMLYAMMTLPADVRLVIVGGDPAGGRGRRRLRALIDRLELADRVTLAGPQPYDRLPLYYAAADVSVLASYREGCPNVVLESLACGTPVVASEVGAVPDLILDGRNGRIVPPRNADAIAQAVLKLLEHPPSAEQVRRSPAVRTWTQVADDALAVLACAAGSKATPKIFERI